EIANVLHGLLIGILNPATIGSPEDFEFLAQSILDALTADKEAMQHTSIQQVLTSIDRFGLDKINGLKPSIEKFVSAPASEIGQSISELSTGLVGKGALSISELVAAENVRNVPIPAALRTESKEPARPNIDVLLSALRQVRSMIIYSLWPSLMKDTNLVYLVVLLGRIDQNLTRRRRKMRQLKTALVTHPSATLTDELLARSPVWVIDNDPENYIRIFHDMFHSLKESGFQSVFALLPHSDFWHSYHHARHALSRPIPNITIIDTKLYGLGLGILVREVNHRLAKLNRRDEVDAVIRKVAAQIHYWIVPVYTKNINGHFWFQKMKRQSNWKDAIHAKHIPIIGFGESTGIVAAGVDLTQSLIKLEGMIVETFQRTASSPRIIVIEHHNQLPAANGLANYFRSMYRSTKIIIQQAAPFMANEIGPYIGIVAI
ncbi:hypothetical protein EBR96_05520, partial [bacterium]|nr:hypothetical protein [bacterium]